MPVRDEEAPSRMINTSDGDGAPAPGEKRQQEEVVRQNPRIDTYQPQSVNMGEGSIVFKKVLLRFLYPPASAHRPQVKFTHANGGTCVLPPPTYFRPLLIPSTGSPYRSVRASKAEGSARSTAIVVPGVPRVIIGNILLGSR